MPDHELEINEGAELEDSISGNDGEIPEIETMDVQVITKFGIFKNGIQYDQGDVVTLEINAAKRFIEAGDCEKYDEQ